MALPFCLDGRKTNLFVRRDAHSVSTMRAGGWSAASEGENLDCNRFSIRVDLPISGTVGLGWILRESWITATRQQQSNLWTGRIHHIRLSHGGVSGVLCTSSESTVPLSRSCSRFRRIGLLCGCAAKLSLIYLATTFEASASNSLCQESPRCFAKQNSPCFQVASDLPCHDI